MGMKLDCLVLLRLLQANASTDEVYAQLALVAENEVRGSYCAPAAFDPIWLSARWALAAKDFV